MNAAALAKRRAMIAKRKERKAKAASAKRERVAALPRIPKVILDLNYVNPVSLEFPKGVVIYEVKNRFTGRKNYYNRATFAAIINQFTNDYNLMMMNPKAPIPGSRNPVTRNPIYPRNIRRVTVKPVNKSAAARKIQSAFRKHAAKKKLKK